MPNIKSAKKRVKVAAAKTAANKIVKSNLKTTLKKAEAAVEANAADKEQAVRVAIKKIDQAASKGILKKEIIFGSQTQRFRLISQYQDQENIRFAVERRQFLKCILRMWMDFLSKLTYKQAGTVLYSCAGIFYM